jgi:serine protease Do
MRETIDKYKNAIVQIATPWGTGTGFYLKSHQIIITNRHVIEGCREVVISGKVFKKEISNVLYADSVYDIAFITSPKNIELPDVHLCEQAAVKEGDRIMAIGHPYGLKFTATQGIVSKALRQWNGVNYIQIDAAINPGNSGGPLIDDDDKIVGVNTFIIADGQNLGFALPVNYLKDTINDYKEHQGIYAIICSSCSNIVTETTVQNEYCPHCGVKIGKEAFEGKKYIPSSAAIKIEEIITKLNYDIRLARIGRNFWEIDEGSAKIKINYNPDNRYLVAYSTLCRIPKKNIGTIYEFLLRQNVELKGLSFSVINQDIILSSMYIYDEDINIETGIDLFQRLFKKSDEYDDLLISMGAVSIDNEDED